MGESASARSPWMPSRWEWVLYAILALVALGTLPLSPKLAVTDSGWIAITLGGAGIGLPFALVPITVGTVVYVLKHVLPWNDRRKPTPEEAAFFSEDE